MFRSLTSFCRSGNLGEVSVENNLRHEHFIYEEGKKNENFEAVWGYFWRLLESEGFTRCGIIHVADGTPRIAYQRMSLTQSQLG